MSARRTRLSPNFKLSEFDQHAPHVAVPTYMYRPLQKLCTELLEPLRKRYGPVHILSGYRTRAHNDDVGGARHSFHLYADRRTAPAADIVCERGTPAEWFHFLDDRGAGGLGIYTTHVHVDQRVARARW